MDQLIATDRKGLARANSPRAMLLSEISLSGRAVHGPAYTVRRAARGAHLPPPATTAAPESRRRAASGVSLRLSLSTNYERALHFASSSDELTAFTKTLIAWDLQR